MPAIFKVLSVLLTYPDEDVRAAGAELRAALERDRLIDAATRRGLIELVDDLCDGDLMGAQERYVFLFDRTRSLSLHLFEHIHGESRDRGQAMVDLKAMYEDRGLALAANELPDFLPLFLEFLSTLPLTEAQSILAQPLHIVVAIGERLRKRGSIYASAFAALQALADAKPKTEDLEELRRAPDDDPNDLAALDRAWEDAPVTFGGGTTGDSACVTERLQTKLRAAIRSADAPAPRGNERRT